MGFEQIRAMIKGCQEQVPQEMTDCPKCAWPLDKTEDGIMHCKFCGWHYPMRVRKTWQTSTPI